MEFEVSFLNEFVDMILELSAEAHVRRRLADRGSREFHNSTGAIAAYGTILAVLTILQRAREFSQKADEQHSQDCAQQVVPYWVS